MTQHDFQPEDGARMDESQSIDEQPKHHTPQGVTRRDVVLVVQADEAHHRALPRACRRDSHEGLRHL